MLNFKNKKNDIKETSDKEDNQDSSFYSDYEEEKKEESSPESNQSENNEESNKESNLQENNDGPKDYQNTHYAYKEKEYNSGYLDSHTTVTAASKASRFILVGFYVILIVVGVLVFFMMRANKYEFYLKRDEVNIYNGSTYQVELTPKNARYFDYKNYNYSIADESVAKVDEFGKITAVGPGRTTLKISLSPGFTSKTMTIISEDVDLESVTLMMYRDGELVDGHSIEMLADQSINLKAIANNREELTTTVKYSSSNKNVATVDDFGNVVAKSAGKTTITGYRDDVEDSITVTVKGSGTNETGKEKEKPAPAPVKETKTEIESITLNKTSIDVGVGKAYKLTVSVKPKSLSSSNFTWTSSNESVATVNSNGVVTGVKEGETTIYVESSNGISASCKVRVTNKMIEVKSIKLNSNSRTIKANGTYQLIATVEPSNATEGDIIWTSSNTNIATVSKDGLVKGVSSGTVKITASTGNGKVSATCTITVQKQETTSRKVVIDISSTEMYVGDKLPLTARLEPSSGNSNSVSWSSSNVKVATVDQNGKVTAISNGNVVITAKIDGVEGNCIIVVRNKNSNQQTAVPTVKPTDKPSSNEPSIPASTVNSKFINVSTNKIELSTGETKSFVVKLYNAVGVLNVKTKAAVSSDSTIHVSLDKDSTGFLDGLSADGVPQWVEATIKVTGKSKGYTYITVIPEPSGLVSYDPADYLTGEYTILVHVK